MTDPDSPEPRVQDFETALHELETLVTQLEDGSLTLEQSLELFERGITLSRYCHGKLEEAERRLEVLTERGEPRPAPDTLLDPASDGDS